MGNANPTYRCFCRDTISIIPPPKAKAFFQELSHARHQQGIWISADYILRDSSSGFVLRVYSWSLSHNSVKPQVSGGSVCLLLTRTTSLLPQLSSSSETKLASIYYLFVDRFYIAFEHAFIFNSNEMFLFHNTLLNFSNAFFLFQYSSRFLSHFPTSFIPVKY